MSRSNFPQQAIATRRQTAQLAARTLTTERQQLFDLVLRLSFDLGRAEAPVPSAAWVARSMGVDKGDVSRAEKSLVGFGMLKVRVAGTGPDKRRYYKPEPDVGAWGGEGFAWRIADPQARALAILAECQLATCEGPENPEQATLPLDFVPTISEEYHLGFEEAKIEAAIEAAGAMPAAPLTIITGAPAPSSSETPESKFLREFRDWKALKDRLAVPENVGQPDNEVPSAASSATATGPAQGEQTLARQPTLLGKRWPAGQRSRPAPEGTSLATRPTNGGKHGPPVPSGDVVVGCPANDPGKTLATQPTNSGPSHAGARMSGTLNIHHSSEVHLTSNIAENAVCYGGMENVASAAGRMENVPTGRAPDELLRMLFEVVHVGDSYKLINHWRRLLGPKPRQALALDLLGEIELRRKDTAQGRGKPIDKPGAWFVSEFYKRAGIPRPAHKAKS